MPFILGDSFLRSVVAIFDLEGQIGLARRPRHESTRFTAYVESAALPWCSLFAAFLLLSVVRAARLWRPSSDSDYRRVT